MKTSTLSTLFLALTGLLCLAAAFAIHSAPLEVLGIIALVPALVQTATQHETKPANN